MKYSPPCSLTQTDDEDPRWMQHIVKENHTWQRCESSVTFHGSKWQSYKLSITNRIKSVYSEASTAGGRKHFDKRNNLHRIHMTTGGKCLTVSAGEETEPQQECCRVLLHINWNSLWTLSPPFKKKHRTMKCDQLSGLAGPTEAGGHVQTCSAAGRRKRLKGHVYCHTYYVTLNFSESACSALKEKHEPTWKPAVEGASSLGTRTVPMFIKVSYRYVHMILHMKKRFRGCYNNEWFQLHLHHLMRVISKDIISFQLRNTEFVDICDLVKIRSHFKINLCREPVNWQVCDHHCRQTQIKTHEEITQSSWRHDSPQHSEQVQI